MAIYAFDGTWNEDEDLTVVGDKDTNVARFLDCCDLPAEEEVYKKGVGTKFSIFGKVVGGLAGAGGKKRIRDMVKQLKENFAGGDEAISIIGFSRGAALALHFANEIYDQGLINSAGERVKHPTIEFLGLWDVVGAFGMPLNVILPFQKWNPGYDLNVAPNVVHCYHAMALHERRECFTLTRLNADRGDPRVTECWFRGVHSDVGGGNENLALSNIALKWMLEKGYACGLPINTRKMKALDKVMDATAAISENTDPLPDPAREPGATDLFHPSTKPVVLQAGEKRTFIVGAGELYSWTGVKLVAGGRYTFSFSEKQKWYDATLDCGPGGWTVDGKKDDLNWFQEYFIRHAENDRRHAEANWFEVIGALDESENNLFRIGDKSKAAVPYVCPRDAILYCFANDLKSKYGNNKGNVSVSITRVS